jgi:SAM-dependent methyltransferase
LENPAFAPREGFAMDRLKNKPDYGTDGSPLSLLGVGVILLGIGLGLSFLPGAWAQVGAGIFFFCGLLMGLLTVLMIFYVKVGKLHRRDRMLSMIHWQGNENVLDVGTGRGLLMIGAAKKLAQGKSIGIDVWRQEDMQDNTHQNTRKNAELEGVLAKVEIQNQDAQNLPFTDGFFDVALSNLCLHNIPSKAGRDKACREIARVLKPGGTALISDILWAKAYGEVFAAEGLAVEYFNAHFSEGLLWLGLVKAVKPK